jgi:hypothetical protein
MARGLPDTRLIPVAEPVDTMGGEHHDLVGNELGALGQEG